MKLNYVYNLVTLHNQPVKVVLYNGILHALHRDLEQIRVCSVGEMHIDFAAGRTIEASKLGYEVLGSSFVIVVSAGIIGEKLAYGLLC